MFRRGEKFIVNGDNADRAVELLERFYAVANKVVPIEEVQLALVEQRAGIKPRSLDAPGGEPRAIKGVKAIKAVPDMAQDDVAPNDVDSPALKTRRSDLRGRTPHQIQYLQAMCSNHDIAFGVGPAGTGKTYLAVACAVDALERDAVKRIILTRPAVEAGERLGFLPGDLAQKVDPYLRPLYDALYDLLGFDRTQKLFEKQVIEIAPLAYMRGRTLNHAFVILDEAQNTTVEQMKMFLTRIGFGSKAVITGDVTQVDLHKNQRSGLVDADARAQGRARHRLYPVLERGRGAPPAGGAHRRRLRIRQFGAGTGRSPQTDPGEKCKKKNIRLTSRCSSPTRAWKACCPRLRCAPGSRLPCSARPN